ncbi:type I methionyl aminopeptidase [Actinomycetospora endophytica]|uniref:Methionine aminopeptidase n=1 Tax=Actinomycetospora endophytica TaxID=2291215 RepID=A0ABS8PAA3_9PSEU|nr:type I methionyl aminopeptidase [Actinomycetospora endophytica]MCD2195197.1 type I methionyl aminopeptidase [Actinomycetospora endophytica]
MIEIKTPEEIELMRHAGRITADALIAVRDAATVGTRLDELDEVAAGVIAAAGAEPLFLHYQPGSASTPYPGVSCISVNDAVVHGIPGRHALAAGDLVSVDCGARIHGWSGDAAISFTVGEHPDPEVARSDRALIATTRAALDAGIAAARPGAKLGDIAHAIGRVARDAGYGLMENHGGHGIGREMHEAPHVPNEGRPGRGVRLQPGLVLALEPMLITGGTDAYDEDPDGWTLRTADGTRAAHIEHTVAITEQGPEVLTLPSAPGSAGRAPAVAPGMARG